MDLNQYLDMFLEESKENLQSLNAYLLKLEEEPQNLTYVQTIFRAAHTLKGMSATMGFEDLAQLTHELENVLDLIRNEKIKVTGNVMNHLFAAVDRLEEMLQSIENGEDGKLDVSREIASLRSITQDSTSEKKEEVEDQGDTIPVNEGQETLGALDRIDDFDTYQENVLLSSLKNGFNAFEIEVTLDEKTMLKAARAYMVYNALEEMGEIIRTIPSVDELEEEKFNSTFRLTLVTTASAEEVRKSIERISEIRKVELAPLSKEKIHAKDEIAATRMVEQEEKEEVLKGSQAEKKEEEQGRKSSEGEKELPKNRGILHKTIRVDTERLERLMNLFSEMVIDRGRLEQIAREIGNGSLTEVVEHMSRISSELQNLVLTIRMVPVEQVFNRFPRMVRDLAKELGKQVNLTITGAETELDRTVIDEIGDPLVHLLRNAIDHGLEPTEERTKKGKPPVGEVSLRAYHSGNHVLIEVSDDGAGIDREKVLKKAVDMGLVSTKESSLLKEEEIDRFLFQSGFSTAEKISDVSGRGVGLDVVRSKIESLGGTVSVYTEKGKGTTFRIQLPLTLSIISAMLVEVEKEKYAIPINSILETLSIPKEEIRIAHKQPVLDFRGKVVPLLSLKNLFSVPSQHEEEEEEISIIVIRKGDKLLGLEVNRFLGQQEIVLKSMGKYLQHIFAISGATILGDGQVALIIDPNALIK